MVWSRGFPVVSRLDSSRCLTFAIQTLKVLIDTSKRAVRALNSRRVAYQREAVGHDRVACCLPRRYQTSRLGQVALCGAR